MFLTEGNPKISVAPPLTQDKVVSRGCTGELALLAMRDLNDNLWISGCELKYSISAYAVDIIPTRAADRLPTH